MSLTSLPFWRFGSSNCISTPGTIGSRPPVSTAAAVLWRFVTKHHRHPCCKALGTSGGCGPC